MIDELEENEILDRTAKLKNKLNLLIAEYEKDKEQNFHEIVKLSLEPAFRRWKEEIEKVLRPYIVS